MCKAKLCFIHRFLQGIIRKGALQIHLLYIRYSGSWGEMAVAFFFVKIYVNIWTKLKNGILYIV